MKRLKSLLHSKSLFKIFRRIWIKLHVESCPTSGGVAALKTGRREVPDFKPWSCLSTQLFGDFRGFLGNSRKYGLGSLRKAPTEDIPTTGPGPTSGKLALRPTTTTTRSHKRTIGLKPITNQPCREALTVAERFCAQSWQKGGAGFSFRSGLSTSPLGVFQVFF